jgi:hypothetical protein
MIYLDRNVQQLLVLHISACESYSHKNYFYEKFNNLSTVCRTQNYHHHPKRPQQMFRQMLRQMLHQM